MYETLNDLIEELTALAEDGYGELPLLVAEQEHYPLTNTVSAITVKEDGEDRGVWLAVNQISSYSEQGPYAPRWAWNGGVFGEDFDPYEEY